MEKEQGVIKVYDVIQVGYGPVSQVMALALARNGYRVGIFELWKERYPLPRAVCIDHEMNRMLSAIGLRDDLPTVSHPAPPYRWFNAQWKELLHIDWSAESISGGTDVNFIHQPTLENMFDVHVRNSPDVDVHLGWEVMEVDQTDDYAQIMARHVDTGEVQVARAKYLIGADGANSRVRQAIRSDREDLGFEADWLVIDILPHEGVMLDIPPAAQFCNPARPTTIVPAGVKDGRFYRRWEFMRMPGESREALESADMAWKLLAPWVKPHQARMERHKVYNFRSLIANQWRDRRILLAGDAAHVMPPFMGQGMCAGLRDDWNLAWKLDLILKGKAQDSLLDSYQTERRPHAREIIRLSMYLGKVICIADPEVAAKRDQAFFDGTAEPPPAFPHLTQGMLLMAEDGTPGPGAGLLTPHAQVTYQGRTGRFDDVVGIGGFILMLRRADAALLQAVAQNDAFGQLGGKVVVLADDGHGPNDLRDHDGKFAPFMDALGLAAMLIRPDFYMYGGAGSAVELPELLVGFAETLKRHGIHLETSAVLAQ